MVNRRPTDLQLGERQPPLPTHIKGVGRSKQQAVGPFFGRATQEVSKPVLKYPQVLGGGGFRLKANYQQGRQSFVAQGHWRGNPNMFCLRLAGFNPWVPPNWGDQRIPEFTSILEQFTHGILFGTGSHHSVYIYIYRRSLTWGLFGQCLFEEPP